MHKISNQKVNIAIFYFNTNFIVYIKKNDKNSDSRR